MLQDSFQLIEASQDLKSFNDAFAKKHSDSPLHRLAAIKAKNLLGGDRASLEKEVTELLSLSSIDYTDAIQGLETLKRWRSSEVEGYKKAAQAKFPDVTRLA